MKNFAAKALLFAFLGLTVGSIAFTPTLTAQGAQEELVKKRSEKLKSKFITNAAWFTDYDKARAEAKKGNKLIFGYFTRSYAP